MVLATTVKSNAYTLIIDANNIGDGAVYEVKKLDIRSINTEKTIEEKDLFIDTKLVTKDHKATLEIKEPGLYEITNTKRSTLYGFDRPNVKFSISENELKEGQYIYHVRAEKIKTDVNFKVVDPNGKYLEGVSVKLVKLNEPKTMRTNIDVGSWQKSNFVDIVQNSDLNGNINFKDLTEGSYRVEQLDVVDGFIPDTNAKTFNVELDKDYNVKVTGSDFLLKNYNKLDIKSGFKLFKDDSYSLPPSKSVERQIRLKLNDNVKSYKSLIIEDVLDAGLDVGDFINVSGAISQTLSKKNVFVNNKLIIPFDNVLKELNTSNEIVITYDLILKDNVQDVSKRFLNSFVNIDSGLHYKERISSNSTKIEPILGSISFRSLGKDKKPYLDTEFEIYYKDEKGKYTIDKVKYSKYKYLNSGLVKPNKNGYITIKNLKYGTYLIKQSKVSSGYKLNEDSLIFEVNSDQLNIELPNFVTLKYIETKHTFNILVAFVSMVVVGVLFLVVYLIKGKKNHVN